VKKPLINQRQNCIQYRGISFKDLIQKSNVGLGQFTRCDAAIIILFKGFETHGAKNFFRRSKAGEQPLKVIGAVDAPAELVGKHRLCSAGRSNDQQMMR